MKRYFYFPQLDVLRGISFLAIFFFHAAGIERGGSFLRDFSAFIYSYLHLGLDVFFILSSFLLTLLGLNELKTTGRFSFRWYFGRRVLRIWPLYYLIMVFAFVVLPLASKILEVHITLPPPAWYLFFVSNFYHIDHVFFLRFLWTLSVEEQFYLLLGICLALFPKKMTIVFFVLIMLSIGFTVYVGVTGVSSYTHTLTYFYNFALGGFAAIAFFNKAGIVRLLAGLNGWKRLVFNWYLPVHFLLFYVLDQQASNSWQDILGALNRYLVVLYVTAFIIRQVSDSSEGGFFKRSNFLIFTGKISYGLYCFHGIVLTFAPIFLPFIKDASLWIRLPVIGGITYGIAFLSFRFFERPFLRLKNKIRS